MSAIDKTAFYYTCEASRLIGIDRKTLNRYIDALKGRIKVEFNPANHRKMISGDDLLQLKKRVFN